MSIKKFISISLLNHLEHVSDKIKLNEIDLRTVCMMILSKRIKLKKIQKLL